MTPKDDPLVLAILKIMDEAIAAEREEAAKECERLAEHFQGMSGYEEPYGVLKQAALAIRARGDK